MFHVACTGSSSGKDTLAELGTVARILYVDGLLICPATDADNAEMKAKTDVVERQVASATKRIGLTPDSFDKQFVADGCCCRLDHGVLITGELLLSGNVTEWEIT